EQLDFVFVLTKLVFVQYGYETEVSYVDLSFCFFFQAEDGIRDLYVTGVQTCALPISFVRDQFLIRRTGLHHEKSAAGPENHLKRSEERRVGKECRSRWSPDH